MSGVEMRGRAHGHHRAIMHDAKCLTGPVRSEYIGRRPPHRVASRFIPKISSVDPVDPLEQGNRAEKERRQDMTKRVMLSVLASAACAVTLAACGSSSSSSSNGSSSDSAPTSSANPASTGGGGGVNIAAARAVVAEYSGHPSPGFPANVPLKTPPPSGTRVAQMVFGTPVGGLFGGLLDAAAKTAGISIQSVKSGSTPSTVQAAAQTLVTLKPKAVLLPATDPTVFSPQLKTMAQDNIAVSSTGIMNPRQYHIEGSTFDQRQAVLFGQIMADWVIANKGKAANIAFYGTPELSFSAYEQSAFAAELKKNCPPCKAAYQTVTAAAAGSTAPDTVTSYLQAHSAVNTVVFASVEEDIGLPSALKTAGVPRVDIIGVGSDPVSLQYLKTGQISAMISTDVAVQAWTVMDMALRLTEGQPLTPIEASGLTPAQLLVPKDVTFNPAKGWDAFPDFAQQFAKLWR